MTGANNKYPVVQFGLLAITAWLGFCDLAITAPAWYDSHWAYRQEVTVSGLGNSSTLADFPALVQISDQANPLFDRAQAGGLDVFFTDASGTRLDHEIEYYSSAGTKELDAWVRIPSLPSSGTTLYMYYAYPGADDQQNVNATWDTNYKMVQHLQEDPSGTAPQMIDSTINPNNGTTGGSMTTTDQVAGKIDGSLDFDGSNDIINCGTDPGLNISDVITLEAWVNPTITGQHGIISSSSSYGDGYHLYLRNAANAMAAFWFHDASDANTRVYITGNVQNDVWTYLAGVYDGTAMHIYINDQHNSTISPTLYANTVNFTGVSLGNIPWIASPRYYNGILDEVRISHTARNSDWITASFHNQGDPGAYLGFGPEVIVPEPSTVMLLALGGGYLICHGWWRRRRPA